MQAELDNLPFADSQFDLAIFNASFHYSENYDKTLAEALRCVRNGGMVVIADSPWYGDEWSGLQMLEERRALFAAASYGSPFFERTPEHGISYRLSDCELSSNGYISGCTPMPLTARILLDLRPLLAAYILPRARKPSRFRIYTAKVVK